jgi:hypothetical protein
MERVVLRNGEHCIYTLEEAESLGLTVQNDWRKGQVGEWVRTDDDLVCQILRRAKMGGRVEYVRTVRGTYPLQNSTKLTCEEREDRWTFSGRRSYPVRLTKRLQIFCRLYVKTGDHVFAYKRAFPSAMNEDYIATRSAQALTTPMVQNEIVRQMTDIASDIGIDKKWILETLKSEVETGSNPQARIRAIENMIKLLGLDQSGSKVKQSVTATFSGFDREELDRMKVVGTETVTVVKKEEREVSG